MAQRTIKNYTTEDVIIHDIGNITIPANGALDIGGNEGRLLDLAMSDDLLEILSQGTDKYQLNDGSRDLTKTEAIDLIRKVQRPTTIDSLGRWVVRADSRKSGWDTVFQGAGDSTDGMVGSGTPFVFDFSAEPGDLRWSNDSAPVGYRRQIIDWQFNDYIYIKEGTIYYYDIPRGTKVNFSVVSPPGTYYEVKSYNNDLDITRTPQYNPGPDWIEFSNWVVNYQLEGSAPMGDELNTESATELPAQPWFVFRTIVDVPEITGWEQAHGHWSLEVYRISHGVAGPQSAPASKIVII